MELPSSSSSSITNDQGGAGIGSESASVSEAVNSDSQDGIIYITEGSSNGKIGDKSAWVEQIQFKAHYQHYRSIDYASFVHSSVSLDRVGVVNEPPPPPLPILTVTSPALTDTPKNGKEERSGLCWNFPRVKLRRLFNAKSLDDILGRSRSKTGSQTSIIQKQNAQSHSNLSSLNKGRLTTTSETNFPAIVADSNPKLLTAPTRNSATEVVITHSNSSSSSSRVKGAKSDNCLHRIVTSTCTKLGSNSVDNLDKNDDVEPAIVEEIVEEVDTKKTEDKVIISEKSGRKRSQVSPLDEQEDSSTNMTKEKAKLVVANVTYLQRPLSPTPALFFQQQSPANDNNVFRVPVSSPSSISSGPPLWTTSSSSNRNQFYSPPGTNNTQCAKSSYSYNYNNPIKLERPIPRNNNGRFGHDNNNQHTTTQHRGYSPIRANNETSAGPASWSHSDPNNKLRFRPQSPPAGRISRQIDVCDNNRSTLTGQRRISARARPKSVEASLRLGLSSKDFPEATPTDKMGDLESPQYVKRTAHMFDSRYTTQINGSESRVDQSSRLSTGNGPSYLNVSRSVCGYSCMTYNNTNGTTSTAGSNGLMTTGVYKRSVESSSGSSPYRPGTLQAANGSHLSTSSSRRDPFKSTSSPGMDLENSQNLVEQAEVGMTSRKSNILEKIERLYGTNAVTTTSLWRRPVPLAQNDKSKANGTRSSEKIIPILLQTSELSRDGTYQAKSTLISRAAADPLISRIDNPSRGTDKHDAEDDLYSKHHVLQSNHHNSNGHEAKNVDESLGDNSSSPSRPQQNITSRIIREAASPSAKINQIMGKEFQDRMNSDGVEVLHIGPQKTEDFVDGEAATKPVFRIVASLAPSVEDKSVSENSVLSSALESSVVVQEPQELKQVAVSSAEDVSSSEKVAVTASHKSDDGSVEKNGEYFLQVMNTEKEKISALIKTAEERMESLDSSPDSPDVEQYGQIFAVVGKARLLINKKFKQFQGLCNDNIEQRAKGVSESEPFTTKNEDLEGFWDMVLIQVDQIHVMFDNLDGKNGSEIVSATPRKLETPRKRLPAATPKTATKSKTSGSTARDESRRKMLAERRAAMKSQLEAEANPDQSVSTSVQIFLHDSNNTSET